MDAGRRPRNLRLIILAKPTPTRWPTLTAENRANLEIGALRNQGPGCSRVSEGPPHPLALIATSIAWSDLGRGPTAFGLKTPGLRIRLIGALR